MLARRGDTPVLREKIVASERQFPAESGMVRRHLFGYAEANSMRERLDRTRGGFAT